MFGDLGVETSDISPIYVRISPGVIIFLILLAGTLLGFHGCRFLSIARRHNFTADFLVLCIFPSLFILLPDDFRVFVGVGIVA